MRRLFRSAKRSTPWPLRMNLAARPRSPCMATSTSSSRQTGGVNPLRGSTFCSASFWRTSSRFLPARTSQSA
nr:MAG TPA_asm: hypothetical protein [Caudoviricetes sp.]